MPIPNDSASRNEESRQRIIIADPEESHMDMQNDVHDNPELSIVKDYDGHSQNSGSFGSYPSNIDHLEDVPHDSSKSPINTISKPNIVPAIRNLNVLNGRSN